MATCMVELIFFQACSGLCEISRTENDVNEWHIIQYCMVELFFSASKSCKANYLLRQTSLSVSALEAPGNERLMMNSRKEIQMVPESVKFCMLLAQSLF